MPLLGPCDDLKYAALTADDIKGNVISVNKAMVLSIDGEWIIKTTKNVSSTRDIEMPDFVINMLPKEGRLVNINPSRVSDRFIKYLKRLDMRRFRFHDLRPPYVKPTTKNISQKQKSQTIIFC